MNRSVGRAARLDSLRKHLKGRPLTVVELAKLEGVGRRSVERDLHALSELGEKLERDSSNRYFIQPPPSTLNNVEALALYTAARMLQHTRIGGYHYRSAMDKLANLLPEPARSVSLGATARLKPSPRDRTLEMVAKAWFEQLVLRCNYKSANSGEKTRRELHVYFIDVNRRSREAYAYAFEPAKPIPSVKPFKLARMSDVDLRKETYSIPDTFDPVALLAGSFGVVVGEVIEVRVKVHPKAVVSFLENTEGEIVSKTASTDGGLIASLQATVDSNGRALDIQPWLLGWGSSVEVLEPEFLRQDVAAALKAAAELYP